MKHSFYMFDMDQAEVWLVAWWTRIKGVVRPRLISNI